MHKEKTLHPGIVSKKRYSVFADCYIFLLVFDKQTNNNNTNSQTNNKSNESNKLINKTNVQYINNVGVVLQPLLVTLIPREHQ